MYGFYVAECFLSVLFSLVHVSLLQAWLRDNLHSIFHPVRQFHIFSLFWLSALVCVCVCHWVCIRDLFDLEQKYELLWCWSLAAPNCWSWIVWWINLSQIIAPTDRDGCSDGKRVLHVERTNAIFWHMHCVTLVYLWKSAKQILRWKKANYVWNSIFLNRGFSFNFFCFA